MLLFRILFPDDHTMEVKLERCSIYISIPLVTPFSTFSFIELKSYPHPNWREQVEMVHTLLLQPISDSQPILLIYNCCSC